MNDKTWIEINRSNLDHNILQYRQWLPTNTGIAPVIKANAYGHGLCEIAAIYDQNPYITRLCVANTQEALLLRKRNIKKPILVLGYINSDIKEVLLHSIDLAVFDKQTIDMLQTHAKQLQQHVNVHLKVDTGMSRLGIHTSEFSNYIQYIKHCPNLVLQGIWSHLYHGNNPQEVIKQEKLFKQYHNKGVQLHIANSLGSLHSTHQYDFARIGCGLYGYLLTKDKQKQNALKPVLSVKTKIVFIKKLQENCHVSYQDPHAFLTKEPTKIAILPIGYFDGLSSKLTRKGFVIVHGKLAPILSINMNLTTVNITNIKNCKIDDTVTVLGQEQDVCITAYDWQKILKTNVRECLTSLESSLPRIIVHQKPDNKTSRASSNLAVTSLLGVRPE